MVHLSNVDLSSASESEDDRELSQNHSNRRSNMAAQRAASNNIIRIEMMGEKSKPIRMRQNVDMVVETSMDVLISRTAVADEQKDKSWEEDL